MKLIPGVGKIEGSPNSMAGAEAVARVDAMFLKRMRQIHIGPSLAYPAVGAVPHITIAYYNRLHRDQRFLFDVRNCPLPTWNQQPRLENPPYTCSRGKNKRMLVGSLNSKPRAVPSRIGKHIFC